MVRGDTKSLAFKLKNGTEYIDGSLYSEVEVQFNSQAEYGSIKKLKSNDQVSWNSTNSCFIVELTQKDTFALPAGTVDMQVRLDKGIGNYPLFLCFFT